MRPFELHRDIDVSGVSGVGLVAEGVQFADGAVALRWVGDWPTSVVFHDRGVESVHHIHGHGGATRLVWIDDLGCDAEVQYGDGAVYLCCAHPDCGWELEVANGAALRELRVAARRHGEDAHGGLPG